MKPSDVKELYYITHSDNIPSILKYGILCHDKSKKIICKSVADPAIQKRRDSKQVPNGWKLHQYVNLYFNPRNSMILKIRERHENIAVLRVNSVVLKLKDVVLTDKNASSDYVRYYPSPNGLQFLEKDLVYSQDWRSRDRIEYFQRKSAVCAEILVPNLVPSMYIEGAFVSCISSLKNVIQLFSGHNKSRAVAIKRKIFFL